MGERNVNTNYSDLAKYAKSIEDNNGRSAGRQNHEHTTEISDVPHSKRILNDHLEYGLHGAIYSYDLKSGLPDVKLLPRDRAATTLNDDDFQTRLVRE